MGTTTVLTSRHPRASAAKASLRVFRMSSVVRTEIVGDEQHAASSFQLLPQALAAIEFQGRISADEISSPISSQLFDFCNNELFETVTASQAASRSNCGFDEHCSYSASGSSATAAVKNCSNLSMIFDPDNDNEISASIYFSPCDPFSSPPYLTSAAQENQFYISHLQPQIVPSDPAINDGVTQYACQVAGLLTGTHPLRPVFEDECLSSVPSHLSVNPSSSSATPCNMLDISLGPHLHGKMSPPLYGPESFSESNVSMGSEIPPSQLFGYQDDSSAYFSQDWMQKGLYFGKIQSLCSDSVMQWKRSGPENPNRSIPSEIRRMEEQSYRAEKLSIEQKKEKIHKYLKKRNERNFSKKIKYACRKMLADSRPRVRGRFAKNDEYGLEQPSRTNYNHQEYNEYDEYDGDILVMQEDIESSDIFPHISGVNSFNRNFQIQSWI